MRTEPKQSIQDFTREELSSLIKPSFRAKQVYSWLYHKYVNSFDEMKNLPQALKDELKEMIVFDFHNMKYDHGLKDLDIILCRNVMIYFDEEEQKRLVNKFYENINDEGYLLLGHTESLQGWDAGFEFVHDRKGTAYRKCKKELV